jgi:hypothetical protein
VSNSLAIAAVTATLQTLIFNTVKDVMAGSTVEVSNKPPSKVRQGQNTPNQLNWFLYQVEHSATWQNDPMPPDPASRPPLGLTLYYLLSAYGENDDDVKAHTLLGYAMSLLHDTPVLGPQLIRDTLEGNDLYQQLERIRITRQPVGTEEMSKLWSTFQADYRVSVAYQVSVVLIESRRPTIAALPILQRGRRIDETRDEGVVAVAGAIPPFPTIEAIVEIRKDKDNKDVEVELSKGKPSVQVGAKVRIKGHHLSGKKVAVRFSSPRLDTVPPMPPETKEIQATGTETEVEVIIPDDNSMPAGIYTVAVVVTVEKQASPDFSYEDSVVSNEVALGIAPQIQSPMPLNVNEVNNSVTIILQCKPRVKPEQRVSLFLDDREVRAEKRNNLNDPLKFIAKPIEPGTYLVRMRVDGVDTHLVVMDDPHNPVPKFDQNQKVIVT